MPALAELDRGTVASAAQFQCVCGSRSLEDLGPCRPVGVIGLTGFEASLSEQVSPGNLYRCRQCFLGLRLPRPDQCELKRLYAALPADRWMKAAPLSAAQQWVIYQASLWMSESQSAHANLRILDVGAFDGRFLNAMPPTYERFAIEPSAGGQSELAKKAVVLLKPFLEVASEDERERFDMVTLFDVFEHLADPVEGVQALMTYVRPGGRLVIATGDLDHWSWRATGGFHWYLDPIQHIVFGSRQHFRWLQSQLPPCRLETHVMSHQCGNLSDRVGEAVQMLYFGLRRRRGMVRILLRLLHMVPKFKRLSHKQAVPYTQKLHDHVVAVYVRR